MKDKLKHFFGLRKIKSLIALALCFGIWQLIRLIFPDLDGHPLYAYLYAIIEMRNSIETEKRTSLERIKCNVVGFSVAFIAIALRDAFEMLSFIGEENLYLETGIILVGVLIALNIAEVLKCKTLGAIAAITFIICFWHTDTNPYFYALLRFIQTLMGVGVAFAVNLILFRPKEKKEKP